MVAKALFSIAYAFDHYTIEITPQFSKFDSLIPWFYIAKERNYFLPPKEFRLIP